MAERVSISQSAQRWYYILTSHRPSQLSWRALKLLQRRCDALRRAPAPLSADEEVVSRENAGLDQILQRHLSLRTARGSLSERAWGLLAGRFCFLNQTRMLGPFGDAPLESVEPVSHLWRFHLHYQEYLLDLVAASRLGDISEAQERVWPIVEAWMQANPAVRPAASDDAWHPFCVSRRIAVWLMLLWADAIPAGHRPQVGRSIEEQTRFLERRLEWDLRGNHLFENLRALILSGAAWEGERAERRLDRAIGLCEAQIEEQILPSGEHFERSPMYHAQMLSVMLDMRDATRDLRPAFAELCGQTAARMAGFLGPLLHPDGQIPLLSDAALEETPCPPILILDAVPPWEVPPHVLPGSDGQRETDGYWTWRCGDEFLVFDHAPVGAEELPAHAHNDLLTIEASLHGKRLIVDSGVFDYDDSEMRTYCRSTAAHNVLQIDGAEQCDVWSRFRMGRRGRPLAFSSGTDSEFAWAAATHNAHTRIRVSRVGRWMACRAGGPWIFADWADGQNEHTLNARVHLAPDIDVAQQDGEGVDLRRGERSTRLTFHTPGRLSVETGWYCPDFGVRIEAPVIGFQHSGELPCMIVWTVEWEETAGRVTVHTNAQRETVVTWEAAGHQICWRPRLLV
jgi:uncharacterized heparinase superfamily protein